MQDVDGVRRRLTTAYARVVAAEAGMERVRREALTGTAYDPDAYDALILEWRAARRAATTAYITWCTRKQPQDSPTVAAGH